MKIGVFDPVFGKLELEPMLDRVVELGLEAVEIGTGNYPGDARCKPGELLADRSARERFAVAFSERGLVISALSCHGNPLHPDAERARHDDAVYRDTVRLAVELGVDRINLVSGCPGDGPNATQPNWVTCAWPPEFAETVAWQWDEVVLPYWREAAGFAKEHGVRLGNPSQCVRQSLMAKRLFMVQKGRYRVSQQGRAYLRQLMGPLISD